MDKYNYFTSQKHKLVSHYMPIRDIVGKNNTLKVTLFKICKKNLIRVISMLLRKLKRLKKIMNKNVISRKFVISM